MEHRLSKGMRTLENDYLFSEIARRVAKAEGENPKKRLLRHDIGDVTRPLTPCVIEAMTLATEEMKKASSFRGYAPPYGYEFLREAIARYYKRRGVTLDASDIFVSDGAKNDIGNLTELFGDIPALIPDPTYPVYRDSNLMCARRIVSLPATAENGFLPMPPKADTPHLVYLCSPGNPTGAVYSREALATWVRFAHQTGSILLFDAAYEAYIRDGSPHSIYEIDGASKVAIEVGSLSKSAGFTGVRVSHTVVPSALQIDGVSLRHLWARRQATKFNGVSYIAQRAAEAALSDIGIAEWMQNVNAYLENAGHLRAVLQKNGIAYAGGENSPYLFFQCQNRLTSWAYFSLLLDQTGIVGTPGVGFGKGGEGYFRLCAFGDCRKTAALLDRFISDIRRSI